MQGGKLFKKKEQEERKIAGLIVPIFTDKFSFPLHRSRFSDSAVATATASPVSLSHPSPSFSSGYKTDTNLLFFHYKYKDSGPLSYCCIATKFLTIYIYNYLNFVLSKSVSSSC